MVRFDEGITDLAVVEREFGALAEKIARLFSDRQEFCREITAGIGVEDGTRIAKTVRLPFSESRAGALLRQTRKIDLWANSCTLLLSQPVSQVATDAWSTPTTFWKASKRGRLARGGRYDGGRVYNSWRETACEKGLLVDRDVWRLETRPDRIADLKRMSLEWQVSGLWD